MSAVASDYVEQKLRDALESSDNESKKYHKRRLTFVTTVIWLGPLAVGFLAAQTIFFRDGGKGGVVLILLELLALAATLCISYLKIGRDHERWILSRIRTEMLRREKWLMFGHVGPYSGLVAPEERVDERLTVLNNEAADPIDLLPMMAASRKTWRDALETDADFDAGPGTFAKRVRTYCDDRIEVQRKWFAEKSEKHQHKSELLEMLAKVTLAAAFLLAALHLGLLWAEPPGAGASDAPEQPRENWLLLVALCLPALGSTLAAYRSVLGSQRLALSYKYYANALNGLKESLQELLESPIDASRASLRFRRIVLDVEQLLTEELRQWWMNMAPKQPHVH